VIGDFVGTGLAFSANVDVFCRKDPDVICRGLISLSEEKNELGFLASSFVVFGVSCQFSRRELVGSYFVTGKTDNLINRSVSAIRNLGAFRTNPPVFATAS
jgi:hypothetical protein